MNLNFAYKIYYQSIARIIKEVKYLGRIKFYNKKYKNDLNLIDAYTYYIFLTHLALGRPSEYLLVKQEPKASVTALDVKF